MARVTVEDCIDKVDSPYELGLVAKERATQLNTGIEPTLDRDNDKNTVIALREIADKKIDIVKTWESIVESVQRYQPVEDNDIGDDQATPLNENASDISFDNFEKENASEKKRKKIYVTESDIQKLIDKKKDSLDNVEEEVSDETKDSELDTESDK